MNKRHFLYSLPMILLLIVAVAGWFATDYLGNYERQEIIGESQASVLSLYIYVSSTFTNIEGAVKSLAGSPWIAPALMSKRDQDREKCQALGADYFFDKVTEIEKIYDTFKQLLTDKS